MKTIDGQKLTKCYFQGINKGKKELIHKAVEWLDLNMHKYITTFNHNGVEMVGLHNKYISDFKEAMRK